MTIGFVRYDNYANRLAGASGAAHGLVDWDTNTIKMVLLNTALYTVNIAADQDLADIPAGARVATVTLAGLSVTAGVIDGTDPVFTAVAAAADAFAIYYDTGTPSTSPLIAYCDEDAAGDPIAITPTGNKTIQYDLAGLATF